ncbi:MAG: hypothetical protein AB1371_11360, partial [Pseudomonadota bacterium]
LYNHHLPQTALDARTPMQAMKDWYRRRSDLFQKRPHNHPGHDTYLRVVLNRLQSNMQYSRDSRRQ